MRDRANKEKKGGVSINLFDIYSLIPTTCTCAQQPITRPDGLFISVDDVSDAMRHYRCAGVAARGI